MENKKNKKKLFAIIGASALAFILTVALSVSITLAYFGQAGKDNTTIKMGNPINVGSVGVVGDEITDALPNKPTTVTVNATVTSKGSGTATPCFIRLKAKGTPSGFETIAGEDAVTFTATAKIDGEDVTLKADGEYLYVVTAAEGTTLKQFATTTDLAVVITFVVKPNAKLTNTSANKTITVEFEVAATQAPNNGTGVIGDVEWPTAE